MKGGSAKSTLAVHLCGFLAKQGSSIALVDCDPLQASSDWLRRADPSIPFQTQDDSERLFQQVPRMAKRYDHLVIDSPGNASELTRAILCLADIAVIPTGISGIDLRAAEQTEALAEQAREIRESDLPKVAWLPCRFPHTKQADTAMDIITANQRKVLPTIGQRSAISNTFDLGCFVWDLTDNTATAEMELTLQELIEL